MKKNLVSAVLTLGVFFCISSSAFATVDGTYNSTYNFTHLINTTQEWQTDGIPTFTVTTIPHDSTTGSRMIKQLRKTSTWGSDDVASVTVNARDNDSSVLTGSEKGNYYIRLEATPWGDGIPVKKYAGEVRISYTW